MYMTPSLDAIVLVLCWRVDYFIGSMLLPLVQLDWNRAQEQSTRSSLPLCEGPFSSVIRRPFDVYRFFILVGLDEPVWGFTNLEDFYYNEFAK